MNLPSRRAVAPLPVARVITATVDEGTVNNAKAMAASRVAPVSVTAL